MRTRALAFAAALAGLAFLGDRPARAQNTYADVPFNQGSLFYRPSGARPPATSNSNTPRRPLFWRQRGYTYATPPRTTYAAPPRTYAPAYPQPAPGYVYPPQAAAPRYYYPTTPR